MQIAGATSRGKIREQNEDAFWYNDSCAVVCDGMGGHQAGEIASQIAVHTVAGHSFLWDDPQDEIVQVIQSAHERILAEAERNNGYHGMGTTMTLIAFPNAADPSEAYLGHVGDSRAYLWRAGRLQQLTTDHSVAQELVRSGALDPTEVDSHPQRNMLTQALGAGIVQVETAALTLQLNDGILLCSDGLTAALDEKAIASLLEQTGSVSALAESMVDAADQAGGPDNTTVIVIRIGSPD